MKIGIVNDIKMTVEALRLILKTNPNYEIAWIAYDGVEAVEKSAAHPPDLILMDIMMPNMGGVEATRIIMKNCPCAILIVTSTVSGNSPQIFEAMGYGALDVVKTPSLDMNRKDLGGGDLLRKIERISFLIPSLNHKSYPLYKRISAPPLLVIGSSTGGPKALASIISHFSKKTSFATVIIQHVDEQFAPGLAKWLSVHTSLPVQVALHGTELAPGNIFIAGKNDHLTMTEECFLNYTEEPVDNPYRPSVDVFFNSVARYWPKKSVGVLLTGMGGDGALGLKNLKEAGWYTIAQREETCVVYGMPKAAVEIGAATSILPLDRIGPEIMEMFKNLENK